MTGNWLPIRYRDFHDIPRAVVVEYEGRLLLLDCNFDYDLDDFESDYTVYVLPDELRDDLDTISWTDLGHHGQRIGVLNASGVEFDDTRRGALCDSAFEGLELP